MTDTNSTTNAEPVKSELDQATDALRDGLKDHVKGWLAKRAVRFLAKRLKKSDRMEWHTDGTLSLKLGGDEEGRPYVRLADLFDDDQKIVVEIGYEGGENLVVAVKTGDIFGGLD